MVFIPDFSLLPFGLPFASHDARGIALTEFDVSGNTGAALVSL
jgi:hypothetical protein